MTKSGLGIWFGAFQKVNLLGALGVIRCEQLGRFQEVVVHPSARGEGVGTSLVYQASQHCLEILI